MSSDTKERDTNAIDRRHFLMAGAAAGDAAAGVGVNNAFAQPKAPDPKKPWTNSKTGVRTAIITDTQLNIGPYLAREMAKLKYNLVIADVQKYQQSLQPKPAAQAPQTPAYDPPEVQSDAAISAALDGYLLSNNALSRDELTAIKTEVDAALVARITELRAEGTVIAPTKVYAERDRLVREELTKRHTAKKAAATKATPPKTLSARGTARKAPPKAIRTTDDAVKHLFG